MLKTLVALCFYLDQRFALRERGMRVFWSIIADLQYVEKETGMMRQSGETIGEWLSVIWCALSHRRDSTSTRRLTVMRSTGKRV